MKPVHKMNSEPQKMTQNASPILPFELWAMISPYLPTKDAKSMCLVSRLLRNGAYFRIERVFLSANLLIIEVFRAIANHNVFRHGVTEIIWDDARFSKGPENNYPRPAIPLRRKCLWPRNIAWKGN